MIWVIGDIHGMFDPLKRLMTRLIELHQGDDEEWKIQRLIFIGDYIDYGPSSKEVIDYITALPFDKVFLMGNHDDLLLQFIKDSDLFQRYGNVWFRGSGGQTTVMSFFPELACSDDRDEISRDAFALDDAYVNFFENLKWSHEETVGGQKLVFIHALPNLDFPLEEQLAISSYDEFHEWRRERKVWIEDTFIWNKKEPVDRFGDFILVHGHLPTPYIDTEWRDLHGYEPKHELPFFKYMPAEDEEQAVSFEVDRGEYAYNGTVDRLIAVNMDTGAVYGHRLTALGLSNTSVEEGRMWAYQVSVGGYRRSHDFHTVRLRFS